MRAVVLSSSLLLQFACAHDAQPQRAEPPPAPGTLHTVKPGETVWDIARQSGLTVEEIVEVNGLENADEIAAGQVLFLPAGAAPVVDAPAPAERAEPDVEVAAGDTPLIWPVDGVILRTFGQKGYDALLVAAPKDTAVKAAAAGEVLFAGDQGTAYGLLVVVRHEGDLVTIYGHLDRVDVKAGEKIVRGEPIGVVGTTGRQETPRLHFQVRRGRQVVDPMPLLPE